MLHRLTIGQKLLLFFGVLLALLASSLSGMLFYLSRVNSYVDRHQRITVPGVVTAAEIQLTVFHMQTDAHHLLEHHPPTERQAAVDRLAAMERHVTAAMEVYRDNHAARRHPVLHGMLVAHGRTDLVEAEDRRLGDITGGLSTLAQLRERMSRTLQTDLADARTRATLEIEYERTVAAIQAATSALVEVHRKIDGEMKLEGDRLVREAALIGLGLAALFGLVILAVYLAMKRLVAQPLERLAATADHVTHHDLTVQFPPWTSSDEVGRLTQSLASMLTNLLERSAALTHKTKELEAFTYTVAHDLKGPLREIEGFASLLQKQLADTADPEVTHHLGIIHTSSLRLTAMIDALLKYSRLEQQTLPMTRFSLLEMIGHLVTDRQRGANGRPLKISFDLPFGDLYGEPASVRHAIQNVLDNAIKFSRQMPSPTIAIGGTRTPTDTIVWVRDNGIGLDAKDVERVFGLFERVHPHADYEGTGVGLAIVKLVMDKHRGRAWIESTPGRGATVSLAFPNSDATGAAPVPTEPHTR